MLLHDHIDPHYHHKFQHWAAAFQLVISLVDTGANAAAPQLAWNQRHKNQAGAEESKPIAKLDSRD